MASTHKSLRSSTANKRPTTAIADGQIALNTNTTSPGLFFKDSTGASIIKVGPVHVGTTAPNASPAAGGSSGNSTGEVWLDTSLTPVGVKIWNGSAWVNATPAGSTTVQGLLELATNAETQTGSDTDRAVTPAGLQSKVSDSTSTTSSTTIASSTAVKAAYDLANAALPKTGGTVTGNLEIGTTGSLTFEGATADGFETTLAVVDPTADRTITLPNITGTVITNADTGTVTSTMIADDTIVNVDINPAAAIAHSKLANITAGSVLLGNASNIPTATALSGDVTVTSSGVTAISSGVIVNADVNASAAIAGTKISPDFGSQNIVTTGNLTVDTNTLFVDATNNRVGIGTTGPNSVLDIYRASATNAYVTTGNTTASWLTGVAAGGDYDIYSNNASNIKFSNNGSERMRITSGGEVYYGQTTTADPASANVTGTTIGANGAYLSATRDGAAYLLVNRKTNDGTLVSFRQDGFEEGNISVSGTTVSYNGAHLSRWSQLPSGQERTEILRGTVLSNIDEMCEWGNEENEQLNRMKMSDVEGDKNVSGVFQTWDDDDDTYTNDFYCAMTGDFIIRIGAGVTVERGDLLMSAGDGTAKPQDDDIIRSKTVAKVTSTNVSCTYDDGSYCVPCVLMAC